MIDLPGDADDELDVDLLFQQMGLNYTKDGIKHGSVPIYFHFLISCYTHFPRYLLLRNKRSLKPYILPLGWYKWIYSVNAVTTLSSTFFSRIMSLKLIKTVEQL